MGGGHPDTAVARQQRFKTISTGLQRQQQHGVEPDVFKGSTPFGVEQHGCDQSEAALLTDIASAGDITPTGLQHQQQHGAEPGVSKGSTPSSGVGQHGCESYEAVRVTDGVSTDALTPAARRAWSGGTIVTSDKAFALQALLKRKRGNFTFDQLRAAKSMSIIINPVTNTASEHAIARGNVPPKSRRTALTPTSRHVLSHATSAVPTAKPLMSRHVSSHAAVAVPTAAPLTTTARATVSAALPVQPAAPPMPMTRHNSEHSAAAITAAGPAAAPPTPTSSHSNYRALRP